MNLGKFLSAWIFIAQQIDHLTALCFWRPCKTLNPASSMSHCSHVSLISLVALQEAAAREQEMVARLQREQEDNMSEMDKAKELLKMKTVKIQRAAASEVRFGPA